MAASDGDIKKSFRLLLRSLLLPRLRGVLLSIVFGTVALTFAILAVYVIWKVPPELYEFISDAKDRANAEATTRTGLIAGLVGLAALGSLAVNARTYRLTQQQQLTDRYAKAIAQLADDKLEIRLGGIYALERLAVDSKRDHPTVVEVLGAFVRERARDVERTRQVNRKTAHPPHMLSRPRRLSTDIQAAVTVLGRLPYRVSVGRGDLSGASLRGVRLPGSDLSGANLSNTDLSDAYMANALLRMANLRQANMTDATLEYADLTWVRCSETVVKGANLTEAIGLAGAVGSALLRGMQGDERTVLPDGAARPDEWLVLGKPQVILRAGKPHPGGR